jgi:hypothetical protein
MTLASSRGAGCNDRRASCNGRMPISLLRVASCNGRMTLASSRGAGCNGRRASCNGRMPISLLRVAGCNGRMTLASSRGAGCNGRMTLASSRGAGCNERKGVRFFHPDKSFRKTPVKVHSVLLMQCVIEGIPLMILLVFHRPCASGG